MSVVFISPALPDGKLPSEDLTKEAVSEYGDWVDWGTSDIVDALSLQRNWAVLYNHANGRLNGTDMDTAFVSSTIFESTYMIEIDTTVPFPTSGQRHSHNGIDSAVLGNAAIAGSLLPTSAFGMIRSPSYASRGFILHGTAANDEPASSANSSITKAVAVPYDSVRWGATYLMDAASGSSGRLMVSPYIANWTSLTKNQKGSFSCPAAHYHLDGAANEITELSYQIQDNDFVDDATAIPAGWVMQWMVVGLVN